MVKALNMPGKLVQLPDQATSSKKDQPLSLHNTFP